MPKPSLYLHPVRSKQSSPPDAAQAELYTHVLAVLIAAPLAPCVIGHGAGSDSLRLLHGLEWKLVVRFVPRRCPSAGQHADGHTQEMVAAVTRAEKMQRSSGAARIMVMEGAERERGQPPSDSLDQNGLSQNGYGVLGRFGGL